MKCEGTEKLPKEQEKALIPFKTWIEGDNGRTCPFRTPRSHERLRDCGLEDYFEGNDRLARMATKTVIGNMTGDIFKPFMWKMVWRSPCGATLKGIAFRHAGKAGAPPITITGDPSQTIVEFEQLCRTITSRNPEFGKYLANSPYHNSQLTITKEPSTWNGYLHPLATAPKVIGIVQAQKGDAPALVLLGGAGGQRSKPCLVKNLPDIEISEKYAPNSTH